MQIISELLLKQNVDEEYLIKLWKRKHNNDIALYFFEKYKDETLNIVYKKINNKFSSIPFEKNDLFHIFWESILNSLKIFNFNKNVKIKTLIINKTYWLTLREIEKFLQNSELVLNTAYSYDKLFEKNANFNLGKNGQNNINITYGDVTKKFIDEIIVFNKRYNKNILKKVIYLRSLGYTLDEISSNLKLPKNSVYKMLKFIWKITEKLYD